MSRRRSTGAGRLVVGLAVVTAAACWFHVGPFAPGSRWAAASDRVHPVLVDGVPRAGSPQVRHVLERVHAADPGAPWWAHVTGKVSGLGTAGVDVPTDYRAERVGDARTAVRACEALRAAVATDAPVTVRGTREIRTLQLDGSVDTRVAPVALAAGTRSRVARPPRSTPRCAANWRRSGCLWPRRRSSWTRPGSPSADTPRGVIHRSDAIR